MNKIKEKLSTSKIQSMFKHTCSGSLETMIRDSFYLAWSIACGSNEKKRENTWRNPRPWTKMRSPTCEFRFLLVFDALFSWILDMHFINVCGNVVIFVKPLDITIHFYVNESLFQRKFKRLRLLCAGLVKRLYGII